MISTRWLHTGLLAILLFPSVFSGPALGWGTMAHGFFTHKAIDRLPGRLGDFFRANRDFLVCYSVLPDGWWGNPDLVPLLPAGLEMPAGTPGPSEIERHFFAVDDEAYQEAGSRRSASFPSPIDRAGALEVFRKYVQRHGQEALDRFLKQHPSYTGGLAGLPAAMMANAGEVVWVIQERLADLSAAMKRRDWKRALFLATVLGHYVGDAHVPLHTATNYNGATHPNRLVKGIHGRWEGRMLERNEADVQAYLAAQLQTPRPRPLTAGKVSSYVFEIVTSSHALVDNLYATDDDLLRPGTDAPLPDPSSVYTDDYYRSLYARLGASAKLRLWQSVEDLALFWDLAWRMAGKPAPPRGKIDTPGLFLIDYRNDRIVPYDPAIGPRDGYSGRAKVTTSDHGCFHGH